MPPNEDPKSEQVSQSIEAEIERKVSERLRELEERLDQRVQASIRDDRAFVKDTIGVAFKVAGFAVAVVVVVLGVLGVKTYSDVRNAAKRAAENITDHYLQTPDGKRITESALDRAMLDSYLVRIALMNADNAKKELMIDDSGIDRLLRIVKNPDADRVTFDSAAKVLIRVLEGPDRLRLGESMVSEVGETVAVFISARDKDAKWLERNRGRRSSLLRQLSESSGVRQDGTLRFSDDQIKTACRELISSDAPNEFKMQAMMYLGANRDRDALEKLVELAEKGKELADDALLAVAKIDPKNDVVKKWLDELTGITSAPAKTISTALKISEAWPQSEADRDTPIKLVEFASRHSRLFLYPPQPDYILMECDEPRRLFIPSTILFDEKDGWTKIVDGALRSSAQQPDLKEFGWFLRWLTMKNYMPPRTPVVSVKLLVAQNSTITLEGGEIIDRRSAPNGVVVVPEEETKDGKPSEQIKIVWTDAEKQQRSSILTKFENAKDLRFRREMSF
jgi:hypothetical protein